MKAEKEAEIAKVKEMRRYYAHKAMRLYVLGPLKALVQENRDKGDQADSQRLRMIKKAGLHKLKTAT